VGLVRHVGGALDADPGRREGPFFASASLFGVPANSIHVTDCDVSGIVRASLNRVETGH
jgi:hypothetical protein